MSEKNNNTNLLLILTLGVVLYFMFKRDKNENFAVAVPTTVTNAQKSTEARRSNNAQKSTDARRSNDAQKSTQAQQAQKSNDARMEKLTQLRSFGRAFTNGLLTTMRQLLDQSDALTSQSISLKTGIIATVQILSEALVYALLFTQPKISSTNINVLKNDADRVLKTLLTIINQASTSAKRNNLDTPILSQLLTDVSNTFTQIKAI